MGRWRQGLAAAAMAGSEGRGAKYVVRFSRRSCARPPAHAGMVSQGGTPLWRQFGMGHMPCFTFVRRVPWSVPCSSARARSKLLHAGLLRSVCTSHDGSTSGAKPTLDEFEMNKYRLLH